ncbi:MAG: c-type cytochrome [Acidobacteria bacterium]|nr:c-type cytochrome [Acidobacteriota bacterium]
MKRNAQTKLFVSMLALFCAGACSGTSEWISASSARDKYSGPLISSRTSMATAWEFPRNPLTDPSLDDSKLSQDIRWGFKIFMNTPAEAPQFAPGKISCNNCHLNGGQREKSLPLVGVAGMFPEYNKRSGRLYSLTDRIVDCFLRSENATGTSDAETKALPTPTSREVLAVAAYITWLAQGYEVGKNPPWRGQNFIPSSSLIPVEMLDPKRGEATFMEHCTNCHGEDGQGRAIGDKKPGPLWGPDSWNDGAGAARIYTLAGIIRHAMPYMDPGRLTDEQAQHVAAFINSKSRPSYPFKDQDYRTEKLPVDSVYYTKR